nr:DUF192 domain-containing protein [uncultured Cohaesibacter sp.]
MKLISGMKLLTSFIISLIVLTVTPAPSVSAAESTAHFKPLDTIPTQSLPDYLNDETHLIIQTQNADHAFVIELAVDDDTRMKGLMFRTKLEAGHGMLFDFGKTEPVYMWMKNTYISLDMIFANPNGTIHHIVKGTTPLSESIIGSAGPVRYVLEVPKGTSDALGIKPGDRLLHQLFTPNLSK